MLPEWEDGLSMICPCVLEENGEYEVMRFGARLASAFCLHVQAEAALFCDCSMADQILLS